MAWRDGGAVIGGRRAGRGADRLRRRAATARRLLRESGVRGLAYVVARRAVPGRGIRPEWFVVLEHAIGPSPAAGRRTCPRDVRVGPATDPHLLTGLGHPPDVIRGRLAAGDVCVAATDDAGLAGFAWYRLRGVYDEEGMLFPIRAGEAWGYDLMVAERRRGQGVSAAIVAAADDLLRGAGLTRVVATIEGVDAAARRAARSRGAREVGCVTMLRAGRRSLRREAWERAPVRWSLCRGPRPPRRP